MSAGQPGQHQTQPPCRQGHLQFFFNKFQVFNLKEKHLRHYKKFYPPHSILRKL